MASKNQNKPPLNSLTLAASATTSPATKKSVGDDDPLDNQRKVGEVKMVGTAVNGRSRQAFSVLNGGPRQDLAPSTGPPSTAGSDCGAIEFTREEVEALVNEKLKGKNKFNLKEKCDNMFEYIKRLRICIKWFQELEGNYLFEQDNLRHSLELAELKCAETGGSIEEQGGGVKCRYSRAEKELCIFTRESDKRRSREVGCCGFSC